MSRGRAQESSSRAAADARLGVVRAAERVTRQAALERARPGRSTGRVQEPALPDANLARDDHAVSRAALEQSEIERFRTVLGRWHGSAALQDRR